MNLPIYFNATTNAASNVIDQSFPYINYGIDTARNANRRSIMTMILLIFSIPLIRWCFECIGSSEYQTSILSYSHISDTHTTSHLILIPLNQSRAECMDFQKERNDIGIYPCQNGIWWKIKTASYRIYTWIMGLISNIYIPTCIIREFIFGIYSWIYQINNEEYGNCLCQYDTLNSFFTRKLLPGTRTVCINTPLTSPCDGTITAAGLITIDGTNPCELDDFILADIKGIRYKMSTFLGEHCNSPILTKDAPLSFLDTPIPKYVAYFIFHLSPGDCHRFYTPMNGTINEIRYIPGEKLPIYDGCPNILTLNERVVTLGTWDPNLHSNQYKGNASHNLRFSMVMIGAATTGHIVLNIDGKDERISESDFFQMIRKIPIEKGNELGYFELGSSIVILAELSSQDTSLVFAIQEGDRVQIGQPLLSYK